MELLLGWLVAFLMVAFFGSLVLLMIVRLFILWVFNIAFIKWKDFVCLITEQLFFVSHYYFLVEYFFFVYFEDLFYSYLHYKLYLFFLGMLPVLYSLRYNSSFILLVYRNIYYIGYFFCKVIFIGLCLFFISPPLCFIWSIVFIVNYWNTLGFFGFILLLNLYTLSCSFYYIHFFLDSNKDFFLGSNKDFILLYLFILFVFLFIFLFIYVIFIFLLFTI